MAFLAAGGGSSHLLALRDDGSVVGIGAAYHALGSEYINAGKWKNITLLACALGISVGVTKNGTVVATGFDGDMILTNLHDVRVNIQ